MAMRMGLSVGEHTGVASLSDQVKRFKPREFEEIESKPKINRGKKADIPNPSHESLSSKCIKTIAENFEKVPAAGEKLEPKYMKEITSLLSLDIDPTISAQYVFDENYWKRACIDKFGWHNCNIEEHGLSWKQLYLERHVQVNRIENFIRYIIMC